MNLFFAFLLAVPGLVWYSVSISVVKMVCNQSSLVNTGTENSQYDQGQEVIRVIHESSCIITCI